MYYSLICYEVAKRNPVKFLLQARKYSKKGDEDWMLSL
jgi:hypothetical protein